VSRGPVPASRPCTQLQGPAAGDPTAAGCLADPGTRATYPSARSEATAEELAAQAQQLTAMVRSFQLGDGGADRARAAERRKLGARAEATGAGVR
jgi:hypothetical protein